VTAATAATEKAACSPDAAHASGDLELLPHFLGPAPSLSMARSKLGLVALFGGRRTLAQLDEKIAGFGMEHFSFIVFLYDGAEIAETRHPWAAHVPIVRVKRQMKWYYMKRFLAPSVVCPYAWIIVVDDDCNTAGLDAAEFIRDMEAHGVQIGQPSHAPGSFQPQYPFLMQRGLPRESDISSPQTGAPQNLTIEGRDQSSREAAGAEDEALGRQHDPVPDNAIRAGSWTTFVESGPLVAFSRAAWACFWPLLQPDLVSGYGYDLLWAGACGNGRAAVMERHAIQHANEGSASGGRPNWVPRAIGEAFTLFQRLAPLGIFPEDPRVLGDFYEVVS
jgi:hypothetical protein